MDFNKNHFDIFGLPVSFAVDMDLLADRFLELQKEVHPDRFTTGTDQEKRLAMQWATRVNSAKETLASPLSRAIYMLALKGVPLAENPELPPAFLMEQIERREHLEALEEGEGNLDGLDSFRKELRQAMMKVQAGFEETIDVDITKAKQCVYELQFLNKLMAEAKRLEEKLLDD